MTTSTTAASAPAASRARAAPAATAGPSMRRRRGMTEQAAEAAVDSACRELRLPTVRARVAEMLTAAQKEQLTYQGFLAELLLAECDDRARRRSARRVKGAGFPREKWLGDFDFAANPNPATIHGLATAAWVRSGQPLCLIGDSGTGGSHLIMQQTHLDNPRPTRGFAHVRCDPAPQRDGKGSVPAHTPRQRLQESGTA